MANEIISYIEMCQREGSSLQRGMNFELGRGYSVILMSVRRNAPYQDRLEDASTLIYEGHDVPQCASVRNPKALDQPERFPNGALTQNGRFLEVARAYKQGTIATPHSVRVYEKIQQGIWSYNGLFHLIDGWREQSGGRLVFRFKLTAIAGDEPAAPSSTETQERRRIIPTAVKIEVWKRDGGRCIICGATDELHFDHDLPYSKGGTSLKPENVQLLCARHNLSKGGKII